MKCKQMISWIDRKVWYFDEVSHANCMGSYNMKLITVSAIYWIYIILAAICWSQLVWFTLSLGKLPRKTSWKILLRCAEESNTHWEDCFWGIFFFNQQEASCQMLRKVSSKNQSLSSSVVWCSQVWKVIKTV